MPRKARIDAPGTLHHITIKGIERRKIFLDDTDRDDFVDRLGRILKESSTSCYAVNFNRRHRRHGQLFQNRYKSIVCQEDPYLLELVRYIHLNPYLMNVPWLLANHLFSIGSRCTKHGVKPARR